MNENPPSSFSGKLQIMCDGTHAEDAAVTKKAKKRSVSALPQKRYTTNQLFHKGTADLKNDQENGGHFFCLVVIL